MVVVSTLLPRIPTDQQDLSPGQTKIWLVMISALGTFLLLYHPNTPLGVAGMDNSVFPGVASRIFDLGDYSLIFKANYGDSWQPFYADLMVLLWHLCPSIPALMMGRIGAAMIGLATIIFLYLAGKEAFNRRMGVFAAAMTAVSLPMVEKSIANMHNTCPLMISLIFWLLFRTMRRPHMVNFLLWGAAIGLSVYASGYLRPFVLYFILSGLICIFLNEKNEKKIEKKTLGLVFITGVVFLIYVFYYNYFYATQNVITNFVSLGGAWSACAILSFCLVYVVSNRSSILAEARRNPNWVGWVAATWICMVLSFPIMAESHALEMMKSLGVSGNSSGFKSINWLAGLLNDFKDCQDGYFCKGDAFFGFSEIVLGALGLASVVSKPDFIKVLFLTAFGGGLAIGFVSPLLSSMRIMPCVAPLFLLSSMALAQLWNLISLQVKQRNALILVSTLLFGFWLWTAQGVFDRVYNQWEDKFLKLWTGVYHRAVQDEENGFQVLLGANISTEFHLNVLYENHPVYLMDDLKPFLISLGSNDPPKNLAIYFNLEGYARQDSVLIQKFQKVFPNAQWEDIRCPFFDDEGITAERCTLFFSDITSIPQDIFRVQKVDAPYWTRKYMPFNLRPAVILAEDKTPHVNDPVPVGVYLDQEGAQYCSDIHLERDGNYEWTCTTSFRTKLRVDGKVLFDFIFPRFETTQPLVSEKTEKTSFPLKAGTHRVEVLTFFQGSKTVPEITLHRVGDSRSGQSLWNSFEF